jgi:HEAT repeat protein
VADHLPNIWLMQTQRNIPGLLQALRHENPDIRRRAATSLRIVGDESAVDDLRLRLDKESNPQVRAALIAALDHLSPRKIETDRLRLPVREPQTRVERLIEHLMSNRSEASIQAAHALGELDDKIAVPPLIAVFRNRSQPAPVRLAAAEALLKLNSAPAEATLLAALRSEKWVLRRNGAAILGQLQADWAIEPLGRALYDDNKAVAKTARAALRHIGTLEAERKIAVARQVARNKGDAVEPIRKKKETQQHSEELGQQATMPTPRPEDEEVAGRSCAAGRGCRHQNGR